MTTFRRCPTCHSLFGLTDVCSMSNRLPAKSQLAESVSRRRSMPSMAVRHKSVIVEVEVDEAIGRGLHLPDQAGWESTNAEAISAAISRGACRRSFAKRKAALVASSPKSGSGGTRELDFLGRAPPRPQETRESRPSKSAQRIWSRSGSSICPLNSLGTTARTSLKVTVERRRGCTWGARRRSP